MSRSKRAQHEAERLAQENERMEARLRELRVTLARQKEEREKRGFSWRAGKADSGISGHVNSVLEQNSQRRQRGRRMRVLMPEQDHEAARTMPARRTQPQPPGHPRSVKSAATENIGTNRSSSSSEAASKPSNMQSHEFLADTASVSSTASSAAGRGDGPGIAEHPPTPPEGGGRLLQGPAFDEDESHQLFKQAVQSWRSGDKPRTSKEWKPGWSQNSSASCETQAGPDEPMSASKSQPSSVDVTFQEQSPLSYMDRLLLRRRKEGRLLMQKPTNNWVAPQIDGATHVGDSHGSSLMSATDDGAIPWGMSDLETDVELDLLRQRLSRAAEEGHPTANADIEILEVTDATSADHGDEGASSPVVEEPLDDDDDDQGQSARNSISSEARRRVSRHSKDVHVEELNMEEDVQ